jgi:hypothetical protein
MAKKVAKKTSKKVAKKATRKHVSTGSRASKKKASVISVQKHEDGLLIQITNPKELTKLIDSINASNITDEIRQRIASQSFWEWLKKEKCNFDTFKIAWNSDLYRVSNANFKAYSVAGALADGGRLNIGGSQQREELKELKKFGALYFSDDINTAVTEASATGPLGSEDKKYKVTLKKSFDLWDYDKVVESLDYPGIKENVKGSPVSALWGMCKVPMPSQIIAFWLKTFGGEGFIFESTKVSGSKNIVLIFKDDTDANVALDFEEI